MSILSIFLTGIGLSMDAFAVSLTIGMSVRDEEKNRIAIRSGMFFGIFQGLMPFLGWILGIKFAKYIQSIDHWIAFILISSIGIKMIIDSYKSDEESYKDEYTNKTFFVLAIATSIDALAMGVTFAFLNIKILSAIFIIGVTTFVLSTSAVYVGKLIGKLMKRKAGIFGGIILIMIGIKILLEHL